MYRRAYSTHNQNLGEFAHSVLAYTEDMNLMARREKGKEKEKETRVLLPKFGTSQKTPPSRATFWRAFRPQPRMGAWENTKTFHVA